MPELRRPGPPTKFADQLAQEELEEKEVPPEPPPSPPDVPKTPVERWREGLEQAKITEDEANEILDSMIQKGSWTKSFKILRGRVNLVLRTREQLTTNLVKEAIDNLKTNDPFVHRATRARLLLIGSIHTYKEQTFKHPGAKAEFADIMIAHQERERFVDGLPEAIVGHLYTALGEFDTIVYAALGDGATAGF